MTPEEAREVARELGYPVVVRPSYVLGGRRMEIVYNEEDLDLYLRASVDASLEHPTLVDKFMEDYVEVDVDAVSDGEDVYIGGIMEHVEEAGVHSGTPRASRRQSPSTGRCWRGSRSTPGVWPSPSG